MGTSSKNFGRDNRHAVRVMRGREIIRLAADDADGTDAKVPHLLSPTGGQR